MNTTLLVRPRPLSRRFSSHSRTASAPLSAVLFDMDGTLTDTETVWTTAFYRMSDELGGNLTPEGRAKMAGQSFDRSVELLHQETGVDGDRAWTGARLLEVVSELYRDGVAWQPGARELVHEVRAAGLRTALVTSSPRHLVSQILPTLGHENFDVTICGDEVGCCKPDPEPYLTAMACLGVMPEQCVAIEDSASGTLAAERAGVPVLVVPSAAAVPGSPARTVIGSLAEASLETLRGMRRRFHHTRQAA